MLSLEQGCPFMCHEESSVQVFIPTNHYTSQILQLPPSSVLTANAARFLYLKKGKGPHRSALMYSPSIGWHGTLPTRTPFWMSWKTRPRFSPEIVSQVPPCLGPVSGDSWREREREREGGKGRERYLSDDLACICPHVSQFCFFPYRPASS